MPKAFAKNNAYNNSLQSWRNHQLETRNLPSTVLYVILHSFYYLLSLSLLFLYSRHHSILTLAMLNKLRCHTNLIFSQSDCLFQIVAISSHTEWQTVQIQISWLLKKPTDLDLHCLQRQGISGFSRTRVKIMSICMGCLYVKIGLQKQRSAYLAV